MAGPSRPPGALPLFTGSARRRPASKVAISLFPGASAFAHASRAAGVVPPVAIGDGASRSGLPYLSILRSEGRWSATNPTPASGRESPRQDGEILLQLKQEIDKRASLCGQDDQQVATHCGLDLLANLLDFSPVQPSAAVATIPCYRFRAGEMASMCNVICETDVPCSVATILSD